MGTDIRDDILKCGDARQVCLVDGDRELILQGQHNAQHLQRRDAQILPQAAFRCQRRHLSAQFVDKNLPDGFFHSIIPHFSYFA